MSFKLKRNIRLVAQRLFRFIYFTLWPLDFDDPKEEADINIPSDDSHSVSLRSSSDSEMSPRENVLIENPRLPRQPSSRLDVIKTFLNIVVIGHVDHGKSTLIGHMAHKCDAIDNDTLNSIAKEATAVCIAIHLILLIYSLSNTILNSFLRTQCKSDFIY